MSLMNSFAKLNLRTKLVIGFSAVVTFALIISATAIYGMNMLSENAQKMYDKDLIGMVNGGKTMGNDEARSRLHQAVQGLLNQSFSFGIYTRCCFIQNKNGRIF